MPHSFEVVCGAVARGWCAPENAHKEMDADLAIAIAKEVWKLMHGAPAPDVLTTQRGPGELAETILDIARSGAR